VTERESNEVKLSLRSRSWVNVAQIAKGLDSGGGGHIRASGVTLNDTLNTVLEQLPPVLTAAVTAP
jgi:phosphoesterase RecJ-like protein